MSNCVNKFRTESESIGSKTLPADVYYGVQSLRAMENFPITGGRMIAPCEDIQGGQMP